MIFFSWILIKLVFKMIGITFVDLRLKIKVKSVPKLWPKKWSNLGV